MPVMSLRLVYARDNHMEHGSDLFSIVLVYTTQTSGNDPEVVTNRHSPRLAIGERVVILEVLVLF